ncbi:unnamed protein product, partial [Didymodactylos carnosus]
IIRLADKKAQQLVQLVLCQLSLPITSNHAVINSRSITTNSLLSMNVNGTILLRRSSSSSTRDRKSLMKNNTPTRYSVPATKSDFVKFQSRFPTNTIHTMNFHSSANINKNNFVQYSFSLRKPWVPKIDRNRCHLLSIQNFVNELIDQCMRAAFVQIDYIRLSEKSSSNTNDIDENLATSILLFDCYPPFKSSEKLNTIQSFADQLLTSSFQQSYDNMKQYSSLEYRDNVVRVFSDKVVKSVLNEVIDSMKYQNKLIKRIDNRIDGEKRSTSLMIDDEKTSRETQKLILLSDEENNDDEVAKKDSLFVRQIQHRSSSTFNALKKKKKLNSNNENDEQHQLTLNFVTMVTKHIYDDIFNELKR